MGGLRFRNDLGNAAGFDKDGSLRVGDALPALPYSSLVPVGESNSAVTSLTGLSQGRATCVLVCGIVDGASALLPALRAFQEQLLPLLRGRGTGEQGEWVGEREVRSAGIQYNEGDETRGLLEIGPGRARAARNES